MQVERSDWFRSEFIVLSSKRVIIELWTNDFELLKASLRRHYPDQVMRV